MGRYALYLAVIVLVALFFQGKFIYVLMYALVLLYIAAPRLVDYALSKLEIRRHLPQDKIFFGDTTKVTVEARNPTLVPLPFLLLQERVSADLAPAGSFRHVTFVPSRGTVYWEYQVMGRRRGLHAVGPLLLEVGDPFDLHRRVGRMAKLDYLLVYPKLYSMAELGLPSKLPFGAIGTKDKFFEDPSQMIGIRNYAPGDPLKRIHWKVSARAGRLQVKQYQPTIALETMLMVNMNLDEYASHAKWQTEQAIEVAASLANELHRRGQTLGLLSNGRIVPLGDSDDDVVVKFAEEGIEEVPTAGEVHQGVSIRPGKGTAHFIRILEILARLEPQTESPFVEFIAQGNRGLSWGATLLIVTYRDTAELVDLAYRFRRSGYNVVIVVVGKSIQHHNLTTGDRGLLIYQAAVGGLQNVISWSS
ncbi:MAG TPA: DUF58 domain-containing protein [Firmicutes bacterium]|nr:DUF58 domain-containing protein [Bacillota bacterium]